MKREGSRSPETRRPKEYASAGVHPDVKTHTAELAIALQARGVALATGHMGALAQYLVEGSVPSVNSELGADDYLGLIARSAHRFVEQWTTCGRGAKVVR